MYTPVLYLLFFNALLTALISFIQFKMVAALFNVIIDNQRLAKSIPCLLIYTQPGSLYVVLTSGHTPLINHD